MDFSSIYQISEPPSVCFQELLPEPEEVTEDSPPLTIWIRIVKKSEPVPVRPEEYAAARERGLRLDLESVSEIRVLIRVALCNRSMSFARPRAICAFRVPTGTPSASAASLTEKSWR